MNDGPVIDVEAGLRAVKLAARDPVLRRRSARLARVESRPHGPVLAASGAAAGAAASALLVYLWWRRRSERPGLSWTAWARLKERAPARTRGS